MKKRIPEQEYRRKKLLFKNGYSYYRYQLDPIKYEKNTWGHNCYIDEDEEGKEFVKYCKMPSKKRLRKINNKKVRRFKGDISNGASYRKLSEFWWEIY